MFSVNVKQKKKKLEVFLEDFQAVAMLFTITS